MAQREQLRRQQAVEGAAELDVEHLLAGALEARAAQRQRLRAHPPDERREAAQLRVGGEAAAELDLPARRMPASRCPARSPSCCACVGGLLELAAQPAERRPARRRGARDGNLRQSLGDPDGLLAQLALGGARRLLRLRARVASAASLPSSRPAPRRRAAARCSRRSRSHRSSRSPRGSRRSSRSSPSTCSPSSSAPSPAFTSSSWLSARTDSSSGWSRSPASSSRLSAAAGATSAGSRQRGSSL